MTLDCRCRALSCVSSEGCWHPPMTPLAPSHLWRARGLARLGILIGVCALAPCRACERPTPRTARVPAGGCSALGIPHVASYGGCARAESGYLRIIPVPHAGALGVTTASWTNVPMASIGMLAILMRPLILLSHPRLQPDLTIGSGVAR
jgi:hypothetical protein